MAFKQRKDFLKAQSAMMKNDYAGAEGTLSQMIEKDAKAYELYLHRALVRIRLGQSDKALEDAERCVSLAEDNALSFMVQGEVYLEMKRFQEAYESFLKGLALEQDNGRIHFGLGLAAKALGKVHEAADAFEQALHFERDYVLAQWMAKSGT